ncbi:MAG: tRNA dihydrouridine synthase DusB [Clostridia bacterium]|nr:tRNA dihydrouridine synthase DusB [Clostridia bacterium]
MKTMETALFLAPMAGAGDRAFRETCALFGVDGFYTEMISAKAVHFGDKKTVLLAEVGEIERPMSLQIFGSDPEIMAEAAAKLGKKDRCDWIDLNFGCPVPKIAGNGDGSALMRTPQKIFDITKAVAEASSLPVSVKIRAGWNKDELNAPEIALLCQKAGAKRIAVHGRTREDLYRDGTVRIDVIAAVKQAVDIPVIANGDIKDGESALRMLEETKCDGLMIGRGAIGAPWVFQEIRAALNGKEAPLVDRKDVIRRHLELAFCYKSQVAAKEMRMHFSHYLKGFRGAATLRDKASKADSMGEYLSLLEELPET